MTSEELLKQKQQQQRLQELQMQIDLANKAKAESAVLQTKSGLENVAQKMLINGELTAPQKIEVNRLKTASLSEIAKSVQTEASAPNNPQVVYKNTPNIASFPSASGEEPCTDCNGANPCEDCDHPTETANNTKSWIDINIPNQGDPTVQQNLDLQAANRKKLMIYAGIALASIVVLLFVVKMFKKK